MLIIVHFTENAHHLASQLMGNGFGDTKVGVSRLAEGVSTNTQVPSKLEVPMFREGLRMTKNKNILYTSCDEVYFL